MSRSPGSVAVLHAALGGAGVSRGSDAPRSGSPACPTYPVDWFGPLAEQRLELAPAPPGDPAVPAGPAVEAECADELRRPARGHRLR